MALGPGRYGANAEELLRKFGGKLCVVVMMGGPQGPSFDVATLDPSLLVALPAVLRTVADDIEKDVVRDALPRN